MAFLWGKNKKTSGPNGLPPATREISSSHGPDTRGASQNGMYPSREAGVERERRGTIGSTQQPPGAPTTGPMIAMKNGEPHRLFPARERSESDLGVSCLCYTHFSLPLTL
jgi:hypothetical protein